MVLFGPTGVGKTRILLEHFPHDIEIISADSMQVYRGMDVGTAKPSIAERRRVPHHLIDSRDPDEQFHVGEFVTACDQLVSEIRSRGVLPVISGGTAFYLWGYLYGLPGTPQTPWEIRDRLKHELAERGLPNLYKELQHVDPKSAEVIEANDTYRVVRALEVFRTTGKPRSSFPLRTIPRSGVNALVVGLYRDREELYRRINQRVETMFAAGLPEEVIKLMDAGYKWTDPGMQAIGYREFRELGSLPWDTEGLRRVRETIQRDTRRYAKRQLTFFQKLPGVQWLHAQDLLGIKNLVEKCRVT